MNDVKSFTFYYDYYNLIDTLPVNDKKELSVAILDYVFKDIEPNLKGHNQAIFNTLKNQLNKSKSNSKRSQKKEPNDEPEIKPDGEPKKEPKENKTSVLSFKFIVLSFIKKYNYSNNLKTSLEEWLDYKKEIKNNYKSEASINKLLSQVKKNIDKVGEDKIIELIDDSIANGYKGIIFDKLTQSSKSTYKTKNEKMDEYCEQLARERGEI